MLQISLYFFVISTYLYHFIAAGARREAIDFHRTAPSDRRQSEIHRYQRDREHDSRRHAPRR